MKEKERNCQYCGNEIKSGDKFYKYGGKPCFTNGKIDEKTEKIVLQEEVRCPYCGSTDLEDFIDDELYQNIIGKYIWIRIMAFLILTILIKRLLWG